ncbi:hypothetical protein MPSEU_000400000 [Mayamaea pseudoterrestris]|nr:hypothetical protein MPSEU_000400000 [Mayamaea pseudoterrestris]
MSGPPVTTFWRLAGMTYLQYINRAAGAMRHALKEPAKSKALEQETFHYKTALWNAGTQAPKRDITSLSDLTPK